MKTEGIIEPAQWHPLTIYLESIPSSPGLRDQWDPRLWGRSGRKTTSSPAAFTVLNIYPTVIVLYQRLVLGWWIFRTKFCPWMRVTESHYILWKPGTALSRLRFLQKQYTKIIGLVCSQKYLFYHRILANSNANAYFVCEIALLLLCPHFAIIDQCVQVLICTRKSLEQRRRVSIQSLAMKTSWIK